MEDRALAKELWPDALWLRSAPLIPPEAPKPKGGRPRMSDRAALTGILFVLKTGIPWVCLGSPVLLDIQLVRTVNLDSRALPLLNYGHDDQENGSCQRRRR
jgi:hypothetical protein